MNREEYFGQLIQRDKLRDEMARLLFDCDDIGVEEFFEFESDAMLEKKIKVLKALNEGKSPDEIGKEYYDILENLHVPKGQIVEIQGQIFDPHQFDE